MRIIVVQEGDFEGKAFGRRLRGDNTLMFEADSIRDRGEKYMIIPRSDEDKKLPWFWDKKNVKSIVIFT